MIVIITEIEGRGKYEVGDEEGRMLPGTTKQPLLDWARWVLERWTDPTEPLVMRRAGSDVDALTTTVGAAAGLTVEEGERRPSLRNWKPRPDLG